MKLRDYSIRDNNGVIMVDFEAPKSSLTRDPSLYPVVRSMKKKRISHVRGVSTEFGYELAFKKGIVFPWEKISGLEKIDFWMGIGRMGKGSPWRMKLSSHDNNIPLSVISDTVELLQLDHYYGSWPENEKYLK